MGGKVWSDREERHFWRTAMCHSAKRAGTDRARAEKSWAELASNMQVAMGEHARRLYTGSMLFEHYFQNIESQRVSPHAPRFVREYLKKSGPNREHYLLKPRVTLDEAISASTNETRGVVMEGLSDTSKAKNGVRLPKNHQATFLLSSSSATTSLVASKRLLTVQLLEGRGVDDVS